VNGIPENLKTSPMALLVLELPITTLVSLPKFVEPSNAVIKVSEVKVTLLLVVKSLSVPPDRIITAVG
jgi:hypothetical protein